jgi:hypothetical protein
MCWYRGTMRLSEHNLHSDPGMLPVRGAVAHRDRCVEREFTKLINANRYWWQAHTWSSTPGQVHTWSSAHLVKCTPGQLHTWSIAHLVKCTPGQVHTWSSAHLVNCTPGHATHCTICIRSTRGGTSPLSLLAFTMNLVSIACISFSFRFVFVLLSFLVASPLRRLSEYRSILVWPILATPSLGFLACSPRHVGI